MKKPLAINKIIICSSVQKGGKRNKKQKYISYIKLGANHASAPTMKYLQLKDKNWRLS
jgi:hypothetical protein